MAPISSSSASTSKPYSRTEETIFRLNSKRFSLDVPAKQLLGKRGCPNLFNSLLENDQKKRPKLSHRKIQYKVPTSIFPPKLVQTAMNLYANRHLSLNTDEFIKKTSTADEEMAVVELAASVQDRGVVDAGLRFMSTWDPPVQEYGDLMFNAAKQEKIGYYSHLLFNQKYAELVQADLDQMLNSVSEETKTIDFSTYPKELLKDDLIQGWLDKCGGRLCSITTLNLSHLQHISPHTLKRLVACCPNLRSLNLSSSPALTDEIVISIVQMCPHLEEIDLGWNENNLTPACVHALAKSCPNLRVVSFFSAKKMVTDESIEALSGCTNLESLNLVNCSNITDRAVQLLTQKCKSLRELNLSGCTQLTTRSITSLSMHAPQLESLGLSNTPSDPHVIALALLQLKNLQSIQLAGFLNVDVVIDALATTCKALKKVDLFNCSFTQAETLKRLSQGCPNLEKVVLVCCKNLHATDLESFSGQNIRSIEFSYLTPFSLARLMENLPNRFPNLERIEISGTLCCSEEEATQLRMRYPEVKIYLCPRSIGRR